MTHNISVAVKFLGCKQQKPTLAVSGEKGDLLEKILRIIEPMGS